MVCNKETRKAVYYYLIHASEVIGVKIFFFSFDVAVHFFLEFIKSSMFLLMHLEIYDHPFE